MFLKTIFPALFCLLTIHAQESVQACKFNLSRDDLTFSFCMEFHGSEIEKFRTECEEYTAKVEQKIILLGISKKSFYPVKTRGESN
jgi:hypothetical protein